MSSDVDTGRAVLASLGRIEVLLVALLRVMAGVDEDPDSSVPFRTLDGEWAGEERQQDLPL